VERASVPASGFARRGAPSPFADANRQFDQIENHMPPTLAYSVIDSFAHAPFTGNPAGVVLDADGLSDEQMVAIAREINASETAFVGDRGKGRAMSLRWFTPTREVSFCGHATLAAGQAIVDDRARAGSQSQSAPPPRNADLTRPGATRERALSGGRASAALEFDCAAGRLELRAESMPEPDEGPMWWLRMPSPELKPDHTNPMRTVELLGFAMNELDLGMPIMRTRDNDIILMVNELATLTSLRPNFQALAAWGDKHDIRGFCVTTRHTLSRSIDVHSRFFAPSFGVPEDPVTGSVHGPLAVLLAINEAIPMIDGKAVLNCIQGEPGGRTGLVRALVEQTAGGYQVAIAGRCYATLSGRMRIP
jgi:predicted PhzF superfamily epimerase YddE/YHI9